MRIRLSCARVYSFVCKWPRSPTATTAVLAMTFSYWHDPRALFDHDFTGA